MQLIVGRRFWITMTVIIVLFTIFFVGRNLLHALRIRGEVRQLEAESERYREQIERDSIFVERLRYDDYLEEYAREELQMQHPDERVFIVE